MGVGRWQDGEPRVAGDEAAYSQDETLVVHTATAFWHIAMTVTGTVYR